MAAHWFVAFVLFANIRHVLTGKATPLDDALTPGFRLETPLLIILDTLHSPHPHRYRLGETWLRTCLKSYTRVVEPLLYDLLDPSIRRVRVESILRDWSQGAWKGRDVRGWVYETNFDMERTRYLIDSLGGLCKFGGAGFTKIIKGTAIKRGGHMGPGARAEAGALFIMINYSGITH